MHIIFDRPKAEELRKNHTVLDLETVTKDGVTLELFCLVPGEKIHLDELPQLEDNIKLHNDFLDGYKNQQYEYCVQAIEHLRGKFGGELDSFYDVILDRIKAVQS